jgi:hypothetical protein
VMPGSEFKSGDKKKKKAGIGKIREKARIK